MSTCCWFFAQKKYSTGKRGDECHMQRGDNRLKIYYLPFHS